MSGCDYSTYYKGLCSFTDKKLVFAYKCMIEQVLQNKLRLVPKKILQNTQTLQLFTMIIKSESIFKSYKKCQAGRPR